MKALQLALPLLVSLACSTAHAAKIDQSEARARLSQVLTCERSVSPEQFETLIHAADGKAIVQASDLSDGEYTVPNPVDVFGRAITRLSMHPGSNGEGDFDTYAGAFTGESIQTVARLADIPKDQFGDYKKEVGNHDLWLYVDGNDTYISCSNNMRTVAKTLKRTAREAADAVKRVTQ
ncbi:hypothetical protein I5Q41_17470 [Pseudomonas monteilii]|jgi:hypothetical protein|uniref:hypothetical protein n=1 Tax=Pseudomonas TaxID=286 RepID=UPI00031B466E|nr:MULTISPECIES: hypothetical protein [Pseudomonas]MBB3269676.1 hypothetical protein [Pseudomonas sp. OG7]MBH3456474.1 hypothetical protein [Pseudomonas monteilii]MCJ7849692.1 hypothetical protein [Pseudomonas monteilii]MDI3368814.1 hypothetical protein [Pseudomonas sp. V104_10]PXX70309.1 hypothetical protein D906_01767 [Pseudomonas sp. LAIL14HWK12:I1]